MKSSVSSLAFILALLVSALVESQFVNLTRADSSSIEIESPESSVIYGHSVPLTFNVNEHFITPEGYIESFYVFWLAYSLDGAPSVTIFNHPENSGLDPKTSPFQTTLELFDVPDGNHKIEIMAQGYCTTILPYGYNITSAPAYFTVDTGPPSISILSPANKSYAIVHDSYLNISLTFETDEPLSWVGYSLDGGSTVTVSENGTSLEIPAESSSLKLYANDTAGNWAAPQTVYYEIALNPGTVPSEPFPTTLIIASVVPVALVALGLMVYFRKRWSQST